MKKATYMFGFLALVTIWGSIAICLVQQPYFDWVRSTLSDFGITAPTDRWFNSGLIISGLCAALFHYLLLEQTRVRWRKPVQVAFVFCSLLICAIGFIPYNINHPLHWIVAVTLLYTYPVSLFIYARATISFHKSFAIFSVGLAIVAVLGCALIYYLTRSVALGEVMGIGAVSVWALVQMWHLYRLKPAGSHKIKI